MLRMRFLLFLFAASCATTTARSPAAPPVETVRSPNPSHFDAAALADVDRVIEAAIAGEKTPGGVLWIEHDGHHVVKSYGSRATVPAVERATDDTIYDAASITKVAATTPAILKLVDRGQIAIDDPIVRFIPEFTGDWKNEVTVRHLLTHTSGLRPGISLSPAWTGYEKGVELAAGEKLVQRPGHIFRYSDINFILLGEIVRRVSGMPLDQFARREIFAPLKMKDTGFRPGEAERPRIAPTQMSEGVMLRGVVHDPTSRRMGGVAGHAGLFTTASDLARYARMLLNNGELDGVRVFRPETVRLMTTSQSPEGVAVRRTGGFDLDTSYSRPRGAHFPVGSFGHTGWTGGFLWIDPSTRSFYVFLGNRVHPEGKGDVRQFQWDLGTAVARAIPVDFSAVSGIAAREGGNVRHTPAAPGSANNGIDVLANKRYEPIEGMRVGLITNHTGIDRMGNPTIDLLRSAPGVTLVALFSPEHGIRGTADEKISDSVDARSGLPIYSLYGETRKPKPEQLANLDALVFDIQDIGARFYTYISTMGLAMEAAADAKKKFFVLDRINPISGEHVEGPVEVNEPGFVAWHPIAIRHGMTVGELARMFRDERRIDVDLTVIEVEGWKRQTWQDDSGVPWINTSPNMRSLAAATLYPGVCLLEQTNVSVGRGTPIPFEQIGAPYIDGERLAAELRAIGVPGVELEPVRYTPNASVQKGNESGGVRFRITNRDQLDALRLGIALVVTIHRLYPADFPLDKVNVLLRHPATIERIRKGASVDEVIASWKPELDRFVERREKARIYK